MNSPIFQVDAFTDQLYSGNPAAIVVLDNMPDAKQMQAIAEENNLSETAFLAPEKDGFHIRWFTPSTEVDLCGHATLAAAHVLFNELKRPGDTVIFYSKSGPLPIVRNSHSFTMDFPTDSLSGPIKPCPALLSALMDNQNQAVTPAQLFKGRNDLLVVLDNEQAVRTIAPDVRALLSVDARCVILTAEGESCDLVSRVFAPRAGIPEDPVTGSAHTTLTAYWSPKLNKARLTAKQLSKRTGVVECELKNDRVFLTGQAITYMRGEINIDVR